MARFLVTGGAGFIGSNLAHRLVADGAQVRVADDFSTGRRENLAGIADKLELIEANLADAGVATRVVDGVDFVLHQAAIPSVPRSVDDPLGTHRANVEATLALLDAARRASVKRFVFAASSSAYGDKAPDVAKVETMTPAPLSPYGVQKIACEHYLRVFHGCYGLPTVALRYFNVFGPRQDPKSQYAAAIPNFISAALAGRAATIYGDGGQSRDFCFIENVVEANLLACRAEGVAGEVFNIACGEAVTLLHVIDEIGRILHGASGKAVPPKHDPPRAGDIRHSLADIAKARVRLGYEPRVRFAEGLARTVAWFRDSQ